MHRILAAAAAVLLAFAGASGMIAAFLRSEIARFARVIREAGIKAE